MLSFMRAPAACGCSWGLSAAYIASISAAYLAAIGFRLSFSVGVNSSLPGNHSAPRERIQRRADTRRVEYGGSEWVGSTAAGV